MTLLLTCEVFFKKNTYRSLHIQKKLRMPFFTPLPSKMLCINGYDLATSGFPGWDGLFRSISFWLQAQIWYVNCCGHLGWWPEERVRQGGCPCWSASISLWLSIPLTVVSLWSVSAPSIWTDPPPPRKWYWQTVTLANGLQTASGWILSSMPFNIYVKPLGEAATGFGLQRMTLSNTSPFHQTPRRLWKLWIGIWRGRQDGLGWINWNLTLRRWRHSWLIKFGSRKWLHTDARLGCAPKNPVCTLRVLLDLGLLLDNWRVDMANSTYYQAWADKPTTSLPR